jgi:hypothetical protein
MNRIRSFRTAVLAATVCVLTATAASALEATVVSAKGKTEFQANEGGTWQSLAVGAKLSKGAVISTGFKSELVLKVNESTIRVAPLTRMTLEQVVAKPTKDETRVFLDTGSIKADVKHTADRRTGFIVRSPVATASVRGTIVGADLGFKNTSFSCERGSVGVRKNTEIAKSTVATAAEDEAAPPAQGNGNTVADIDSNPGAGEYLIGANQTTGFGENGSQTSAQSNAQQEASSLGGAPVSASHTENEGMGGADNSAGRTGESSSSPKGATIIVNITLAPAQ